MPLTFKPLAWLAAAALLLPYQAVAAEAATPTGSDAAALERLVSNYALGFHTGNPDLVMGSTHRDLSKRGVDRDFAGLGVQTMAWLEGESLRQMGRAYDQADEFNETTQRRAVILDISGDVAVVELLAGDWYDVFTAVKIDGDWTILDCVWGLLPEWEPAHVDAGEAAEVRAVLSTFADAVQSGDDAALDRVLDPISQFRTLSRRSGHAVVHALSRQQVYAADHDARDPDARAQEIQVLNASGVTAAGKIVRGRITYWVQLLRFNGRWSIVNVHWRSTADGAV
jgi:hypothetical protein